MGSEMCIRDRLRPGAITIEMLRETVGQVEIDPAIQGPMAANVKPKAPGMKYRHYAPKAELVLVEEKNPETKEVISDRVIEEINLLAKSRLDQGQKVESSVQRRPETAIHRAW